MRDQGCDLRVYLGVKSCEVFTTKDVEEGVQTLDTAITDMPACSLNYWLSMLVQQVSISSGKRHLSDVNGSAALNPLTCSTEGKLYLGGIKFGLRKLLLCIVVFHTMLFLSIC